MLVRMDLNDKETISTGNKRLVRAFGKNFLTKILGFYGKLIVRITSIMLVLV